jgi:hypothetical protein
MTFCKHRNAETMKTMVAEIWKSIAYNTFIGQNNYEHISRHNSFSHFINVILRPGADNNGFPQFQVHKGIKRAKQI